MEQALTIGVIGKSRKENEKRVAIHPEHLESIAPAMRKQLTFESGYGLNFGMSDQRLAELSSGKVASRAEVMTAYDCVLIPKPLVSDLQEMRPGTIVWGWPHCVQQREMTQTAIDRKLTLIAWEQMFLWNRAGEKNLHVFYKNNELAGYAGVIHALSLVGMTGLYGKPLKAVILSFGSVSRGAIYALQGQGIRDIAVFTNRPPGEVKDQIPGVRYQQMVHDEEGLLVARDPNGQRRPFIDAICDAQVIINGTLQDTASPKMFVSRDDCQKLQAGTLIVDISCDEGMGFWCARPTSFEAPLFEADGKFYYSVDHSPSYYWNSTSWEISAALLPYLETVLGGPDAWLENTTISKAIEISEGVIQNSAILDFQNRRPDYPHLQL